MDQEHEQRATIRALLEGGQVIGGPSFSDEPPRAVLINEPDVDFTPIVSGFRKRARAYRVAMVAKTFSGESRWISIPDASTSSPHLRMCSVPFYGPFFVGESSSPISENGNWTAQSSIFPPLRARTGISQNIPEAGPVIRQRKSFSNSSALGRLKKKTCHGSLAD